MATKAEQFRSDAQRANGGRASHTARKKSKRSAWSRKRAHAGRKATHAFEDVASGTRRSRESTRGSANRAKGDAAFNLTEEKKKGAPSNRALKSRAKGTRVRGDG